MLAKTNVYSSLVILSQKPSASLQSQRIIMAILSAFRPRYSPLLPIHSAHNRPYTLLRVQAT